MTPTPYVKQTWIDGDNTKPTSAARLGVIETGIFDAHYRPSVAVHNTVSQSITTATITIVTWNTEEYDTDSMHSTVSNTGRLTAPVTGKYAVTARGTFAANATGFRQMQLRINGTTVYDTDTDYGPLAAGTCYLHCSRDILMAAADFVEVICSQSSGGALAFGGSSIDAANFQMHLVSY